MGMTGRRRERRLSISQSSITLRSLSPSISPVPEPIVMVLLFVEDRQCPSAGRKQHAPDGNCRFCPSWNFLGFPSTFRSNPGIISWRELDFGIDSF
jgi:hypothetical protein